MIIDLRDTEHADKLAQFERSWGFNPVTKGKFFGVIGAHGRIAHCFTTSKGAQRHLNTQSTRSAMAGW